MKKYLAELFGTFSLVFAGTGAIVIDQVSGGGVTHVGVALTFGLIVMVMIHAVGDVSGAHLNPAVTLGFFAARRFPASQLLPYVMSQVAGALFASGTLRFLFPSNETWARLCRRARWRSRLSWSYCSPAFLCSLSFQSQPVRRSAAAWPEPRSAG